MRDNPTGIAALFVSIVQASREMLARDIKLTLISLVGIMLCFMIAAQDSDILYDRSLFRHRRQAAHQLESACGMR